ncbi:hypothetical protein H5410_064692 [Solanum commersonii]|uniref:Uncharacterized protein n=1 Tax=Solanum commersonii TaxID=4109 RepID=A0A9J5VYQ8_SOLCO|nr:hypothetical protein H5410_064692 [Solanum commersonii]
MGQMWILKGKYDKSSPSIVHKSASKDERQSYDYMDSQPDINGFWKVELFEKMKATLLHTVAR